MSETLKKIANNLRTQDNRMTADPIFHVQVKRGKAWETVMVAFTEEGCNEYLRLDGHNLKSPRIYVKSLYRCPEMIAIREHLVKGQQ